MNGGGLDLVDNCESFRRATRKYRCYGRVSRIYLALGLLSSPKCRGSSLFYFLFLPAEFWSLRSF